MTSIKELQQRIIKFVEEREKAKNFHTTPELSFIHLIEELGEIARQLSNKQMRPDLFDEKNLKEEIIDVILEALILADKCGVDIEKELPQRIDKLFKRHGFEE